MFTQIRHPARRIVSRVSGLIRLAPRNAPRGAPPRGRGPWPSLAAATAAGYFAEVYATYVGHRGFEQGACILAARLEAQAGAFIPTIRGRAGSARADA
jgi:hypothetical protein